ncbi:helix-turn-helix domain-containing protein [Methylobacterium aquaticum]|uniref:helix-turn-helix domain-containing protein n=1 Tax=Methylobacterium aquaticum TaxID=270351 RepID=UPI0019327416|nr:helix-turn-helix domain-containing protein [Methylobacterium aquaticum]QRE77364.1 helix-turn-helix transcriptional regulator [Methylobacterium aquaticum]
MDAETIAATIARRMRELREERGLSLHGLAERAGLTKSHVWDLERGGSRNPTIATAVAIATALGVSLDNLAGLTTAQPTLHPEALRIACEVDALLRARPAQPVQGGEDV